MSITLVQPYCACGRKDCLTRNSDSEGVCAITLDITDHEWAALLEKYDSSIYVASADCPVPADSGFVMLEKRAKFCIYGPARLKILTNEPAAAQNSLPAASDMAAKPAVAGA